MYVRLELDAIVAEGNSELILTVIDRYGFGLNGFILSTMRRLKRRFGSEIQMDGGTDTWGLLVRMMSLIFASFQPIRLETLIGLLK